VLSYSITCTVVPTSCVIALWKSAFLFVKINLIKHLTGESLYKRFQSKVSCFLFIALSLRWNSTSWQWVHLVKEASHLLVASKQWETKKPATRYTLQRHDHSLPVTYFCHPVPLPNSLFGSEILIVSWWVNTVMTQSSLKSRELSLQHTGLWGETSYNI
jgi:hypothetical protein